jgi:hydrogenase nickel incorporation protein HypB
MWQWLQKMDLAPAVEFDWQAAYGNVQAVRPGMQVLRLSAGSGEGMDDYLDFLQKRLNESRVARNLSTASATP